MTPRLAPPTRRRAPRLGSGLRRAFTLVELLVVITIIAVLTTIVAVASVGFIGTAREAATRATIKKVDEAIFERVNAVNRWHQRPVTRLQHDWRFRGWETEWDQVGLDVFASTADKQSAQVVLSRKGMLRELLPVFQPVRPALGDSSKDDKSKPGPPPYVSDGELVKAYWFWARFDKDATFGLSPSERNELYDWITDSDGNPANGNQGLDRPGEVFYYSLLNAPVFGGHRITEEDFRPSELIDPDEDGFFELADGWGQALRFYRWPTRLVNGGSTPDVSWDANVARKTLMPNAPKSDPDPRNELDLKVDPDDRAGFIGVNHPYYGVPLVIFFHDPRTWHAPLVVSAGADGKLGIAEPDVSVTFHPDLPPVFGLAGAIAGEEESLYDNITNHSGRAGGLNQ